MGLVRRATVAVFVTLLQAGVSAVERLRRGIARGGGHPRTVEEILAAADERDAISDARDAEAEERERALDLAELLDLEGRYSGHWAERRGANLDRLHAKPLSKRR